MRNTRYLVGFALVAVAASCGGSDKSSQGAKAPSDVTASPTTSIEQAYPSNTEVTPAPGAAPMSKPSAETQQLTSHELLTRTVACLLPPSGAAGTSSSTTSPSWGAGAQSSSDTGGLGMMNRGNGDSRCAKVAEAASVSPDALARGDSEAINGVRRLIQSRLSSEQTSPDVSDNTLAFFDKGIATLNEAKIANQALAVRQDTAPSAGKSSDAIRDHKALGELYQFGQNLGMTPMGSEAQALAWVVGVDRFIAVRDLPVSDKPLAAAPLFSALLNVPVPAPTAGRSMPTWNQYLAAAARSVNSTSSTGARTGAVGGGPAPSADEKANLGEVARAAQDRLQVLAEHLPPTSDLRDEVNESITELKAFTASSATSGAGSTSGSSWSSGSRTGPRTTGPATK